MLHERARIGLRSGAWRLALGVAVAWFACSRLELAGRFPAHLASIRVLPALGAILLTFGMIAIRAWRWNLILGSLGRRLAWRELLDVYGASFFLGLVSPAKLGEVARVWWIRDRTRGFAAAAYSVALDRAFDLAPTLLLVATFGAVAGLAGHVPGLALIRAGLFVLGLALLAVSLRPRWMLSAVEFLVHRLLRRFGQESAADAGGDPLPPATAGTMAMALALSVASQAVAVLQVMLLARAVAINVNPFLLYAAIATSTTIASLPLSVAGFGTREAALIWALATLGASDAQALAFSLLWLANFLAMLGASLLVFARRPSRIRSRPGDQPGGIDWSIAPSPEAEASLR
jgi:uncharacterized membrane protein YbhN (UPF0104 family)